MAATGRPVPARAIAVAYLAATLQGLALVSFPASGVVLEQRLGLTDASFGLVFLPQVGATVIGALAGGGLAHRLGLRGLLLAALMLDALSQAGLASLLWLPAGLGLPWLLGSAGCMGLGFGLMGAPMNTYPQQFFPAHPGSALLAMHGFNGGGLMLGPLLLQALLGGAGFTAFPAALLIFALALAALAATTEMDRPLQGAQALAAPRAPPLAAPVLWTFMAIAVLYAMAEGSFSNWAVVYLQAEQHQTARVAEIALSAFWGGLVGGRLLISALVVKVRAAPVWRVLPLLIAGAFTLLPWAQAPGPAVLFFALAGLGCSGFFPLTIALASRAFPRDVAWVSSIMIAALMVGVGLASYSLGLLHLHFAFAQIYRYSVVYPALALGLSLLVPTGRSSKHG